MLRNTKADICSHLDTFKSHLFRCQELRTAPIDGRVFRDRQMMVALGIGAGGRKIVLGLRERSDENASVVSTLLQDLAARGLEFSVRVALGLDGRGRPSHTSGSREPLILVDPASHSHR